MDARRFADIVRALTTGGASRRGITRTLAALSLTGTLSPLFGLTTAYAKKKKRKKKKRCAKRDQKPKKKTRKRCCKGLSKDTSGRCAKPCDVCQPAGACRFDSVQAAIDDAAPGATLTLCAGTFTETIEIAKNLTLIGVGDGTGPGNTILEGAGAGTVVRIEEGSTVTLQNLRITGGNNDEGGGIDNSGMLDLTGCTVSGNTADSGGGGIRNGGTLTLNDCAVSGNTASTFGGGGGIFNLGAMELINSTVSGNVADSGGGGIANIIATTTLINSIVSGNVANEGGGIYNFESMLELIDSSVTANSAGSAAGGIRNEDGTVICRGGSTVSDNTVGNPPVPSNCVDVGGGTGCAICPD